ncbi:DUF5068 domain-containing protein [Bacillus massilinigeriensis]|uniref:DUF5068 domain-containing protein n=1 Tax=Bacillus mediterraneensis TaxID=1805474 RepID=UPI0013564953|nr:DUF5068 domain-containing protein [Bacillus mediterraneensis]
MGKGKILSTVFLSAAMMLSACGNDEQASGTKEKTEPKQKAEQPAKVKSEKTEAKSEKPSGSNEVFTPNIAKESQGNVEVVYTNNDVGYLKDMDGFKVSVNEYQIVKVTDMNDDFHIAFDDQNEGYVIIAKMKIENTLKKPMYYVPGLQIRLGGPSDYLSHNLNRSFVKEEYPKPKGTESGKWEPGEKEEGLISFTLTNEEFESMKSVKPKLLVDGGAADNDQFSGSSKHKEVLVDFIYSDEQAKETANAPKFYPDRLTTENMADKKMIFEKEGINETKKLGDVNVTLEGVQYTELIPTELQKERFRNFGDSGIAALTVKLKLENKSKENIDLFGVDAKLLLDDNRGTLRNDSMAETQDPKEIPAGETVEKYYVFMFRKDEFGLLKKFELEFGPFNGQGTEDQFKGKVNFPLPR